VRARSSSAHGGSRIGADRSSFLRAKRDQRFYILVAQQASVGDAELLLVVYSRSRAGDRPGTFVAEDGELRVLAALEPSGGDRGSSKRPGR